jgi:GT2 family glycosyltransferase
MSDELPGASVVICTRDRPVLVLDAVHSMLAGAATPEEIVVIDQSGRADRALAALPPPVRYVSEPGSGLTRARNLGVRLATHDVIVFADDDVRVPPGWLGALLRALESAGPRAAATGPVLADEAGGATFAPSTIERGQPAVYAGRIGKDVLAGGNSAVRRDALAEVGGFDERLGAGARFPAADDNDFGFRLLEAGYRIVFEPDAFLYHRSWRPKREYVGLRWRYGRGKGGFYAKHLSIRDRHMLGRLAGDVGRRVARLPTGVRARRRALGDLAYVAGVLTGAAEWLVTERRRQGAAS